MTTLLYRGQRYQQQASADAQQLRYDRGVYANRQQELAAPKLTYRGCAYPPSTAVEAPCQGQFIYRGVVYSR